jgi:hypothetical protein
MGIQAHRSELTKGPAACLCHSSIAADVYPIFPPNNSDASTPSGKSDVCSTNGVTTLLDASWDSAGHTHGNRKLSTTNPKHGEHMPKHCLLLVGFLLAPVLTCMRCCLVMSLVLRVHALLQCAMILLHFLIAQQRTGSRCARG